MSMKNCQKRPLGLPSPAVLMVIAWKLFPHKYFKLKKTKIEKVNFNLVKFQTSKTKFSTFVIIFNFFL